MSDKPVTSKIIKEMGQESKKQIKATRRALVCAFAAKPCPDKT